LEFAYCCQVYYRWHTYRRRSIPKLRDVAQEDLEGEHPEIHVLNLEASDVEMALLASLRPSESVASGASKLKGATSKTLRRLLKLERPQKLLGGGYFAGTTGSNTSEEIDRYLDAQSEHHGYERHARPPVWVKTWLADESGDDPLQAHHSVTRLRWHLVFSTWNRKGTFTREAAEAVTGGWESRSGDARIQFRKVSWVPDHVHLAVASHPAVVPAKLVTELLNMSQHIMAERFDTLLIQTGNPRLWKPGAYVGTYGDLANTQIQAYLRNWQRTDEDEAGA
jgi:REP element-mobilizing transposase RayT